VKYVGIVGFYGFEKLPSYQISRDQAKQCLYQFVVEVNDALDVLHNHLEFAHLVTIFVSIRISSQSLTELNQQSTMPTLYQGTIPMA